MTRVRRSSPAALLLFGFLWASNPGTLVAQGCAEGVQLEPTDEGSPLRAGDCLLAWRGEPRNPERLGDVGEIRHPFDVLRLQIRAPEFRGLHLTIRRGEQTLPMAWTREELAVDVPEVAIRAPSKPDPLDRAWARFREAQALDGEAQHEAADVAWRAAISWCEPGHADVEALLWHRWASAREDDSPPQAGEAYQKSLARLRANGSTGLILGRVLLDYGTYFLWQGDSRSAEPPLAEASAILDELAPGSALHGRSLNNWALALGDMGDPRRAEQILLRRLEIVRVHDPGGLKEASTLNNLGNMAYYQGDLATAEARYRKVKEIRERLIPDSLKLAASLNNLAGVAEDLGQREKAELWYRQALEIRRRQAPGSAQVASTLANLASLVLESGRPEEAFELVEEAWNGIQIAAPGSDTEAWVAKVMAYVLLDAGLDLERGAEAAQRSVELTRRLAPGSMDLADALDVLAEARVKQGRLDAAEALLQESLALRTRLAPQSRWQAGTQWRVAELHHRRGQIERALELLEQALGMAEAEEAVPRENYRERALASSEWIEWYRRAALWRVEMGEPERAFELVERSRARAFLAMLEQRRWVFERDLPPEVEQDRRRLGQDYEAAWAELRGIAADDPALDQALARLNELRDARQLLQRKIATLSPRHADLRSKPAGIEQVAAGLPDGVVLLSYAVGAEQTLLFAVASGAEEPVFEVHVLPVGSDELASKIDTFRTLLKAAGADSRPLAQELFQLLLDPVDDLLSGPRRVVIVPDRDLHRLPFAALVDNAGAFLIERAAISAALSASVAVRSRELTQAPTAISSAAPGSIVIFGEPLPREQPLPWSRKEALLLEQMHGERSELFLGRQASETRFRSLGPSADILHFAGHAETDDRFPLDSFLSLAADDEQNGRLQAWEIFESLRIDARLVTLSACDTALGREVDGEGLSGLSQAFLFAGARTVVASQWPVDDRATALLMSRFYHHLSTGSSVDRALQAAQLDLLHGRAQWPDTLPKPWLERLRTWVRDTPEDGASTPTPAHWAAFQVTLGGR